VWRSLCIPKDGCGAFGSGRGSVRIWVKVVLVDSASTRRGWDGGSLA
jgi:hypothetical protein